LAVESFADNGFQRNLRIELFLNGWKLGVVKPSASGARNDLFDAKVKHRQNGKPKPQLLELKLRGASFTNLLAWLSRVSSKISFLQFISARLSVYRKQERNQHLQIRKIALGEEELLNFDNPDNPYLPKWGHKEWQVGINLIGFFRQEFGIGEGARLSAATVRQADIPHALIQAPFKGQVDDSNVEFENALQKRNPHPINLFHVNPDGIERIFETFGDSFFLGKHNIGYWAWELPGFPQPWLQHFEGLQEVWVPSRHVFDAIHPISPVPVHVLPHAIECLPRSVGDRKKFSLPEDKFLFLAMFDLNSTRIRKNPDGALAAFERLRAKRSNCHLVVKIHNNYDYPEDFEDIQAKCSELEDVTLLTKTLAKTDIDDLQNSCDAFISLHRAEGFGLILAECMAKGKPVIATHWSGNVDFMDENNSFPVRFDLVPIEESQGPYSAGQTWAEPNLDHAVSQMEKIVDDPTEANRRGNLARSFIEEHLSPTTVGGKYNERLLAIRKNCYLQSPIH